MDADQNVVMELHCSNCGKHTVSKQSKKRHERYCRMKGKVPSRMKSCLACIKAKARCELDGETCTRCAKKCITCHFEFAARNHVPVPVNEMAIGLEGVLTGSEIPFLTLPEDMYGGLIEQGSSSLQLLIENGIDQFDTLTPQSDFPISYSTFTSIDDIWGFGAGVDLTPSFHHVVSNTSKFPTLFEPIPPKKREWTAASVVATRMLRSYPNKMLQRTTFPPFIHSRFHEMGAERRLPRALANTMSIAQLFQRRSLENKSFFWQSIRTEQQKIMSEVTSMSLNELLASTQALLIFVLMRIIDGPNEDEEIGLHLLTTIHAVCQKMNDLNGASRKEKVWSTHMNEAELSGQRPQWQDWVFIESKRRTITVLRIISFLFNIDVNLPCPPLQAYTFAPVPASRLLWCAETEMEWEEQWEKENAVHGILRNGDLVKLKHGMEEEHRRHAEWDRWYAGTDELGFLVVLAADLG